MTFAKKVIETTITLGEGQLGNEPGSNTSVLTGYRTLLNMQAHFGNTQGVVQARIYGLSLDLMNKLTTIGVIGTQIRNQNVVSFAVGDEGGPLTTIFRGTIQTAWTDFCEAPNVSFNIIAQTTIWAGVLPIPPSSFKGGQTVNTIMQQLVTTINAAAPDQNLVLNNNGVNITLRDQYLPGSALDQIKKVVDAAGCSYKIEQNVLTIYPNDSDSGEAPITLSPTSNPGLIGYPTLSGAGIIVKSTFVQLSQGHKFIIEGSLLSQANTIWVSGQVNHTLESERPGGAWYSQFSGYNSLSLTLS